MTLEQRHTRQDLITIFNITQRKLLIDLDKVVDIVGKTSTRGHTLKIRPRASKLEVRRNSFFCRIWKKWNLLPEKVIRAPTTNSFKNGLKECGIIFMGQ